MSRIIFLLLFLTTLSFRPLAQVLPVWYKDHTTDLTKTDFSGFTNNHSDFSLVKAVDTLSIPEAVSILVITEDGKFSKELDLDLAAYSGSKNLIIAGKMNRDRILMGVTDLKANPVIPLEYLKIRYARNLFALKNQDYLWALYTSKGDKLTDFIYTDMLFTPFGKIKIKNKNGTGILNEDGTILISTDFEEIKQLAKDSFFLKEQDTWECIDLQKNIKFKWRADSLKALNDSLFFSYFEERVFIKNSIGKIIGSENGYQKAEKLSDNYIKVSMGEYSGLIDLTGKEILPVNYYEFQLDPAGYIKALGNEVKVLRFGDVVNKNKKRWSLHDSLGTKILDNRYKSIRSYQDGLIAVQTNENLWGYADEKGRMVIEASYNYASAVKNNLLLVRLAGAGENDFRLLTKTGQVLHTGKDAQLIYLGVIRPEACEDSLRKEGEPETEVRYGVPPYRYDQYIPAEYGYIRVKSGAYTGVLDPAGNEAVQAYQDTVYGASSDTFFLYKRTNGLVGYSDQYCNVTMSLTNKFEEVQPLKNGYSKFKKDGLYGFIDPFGNVQIAPKYSACGEFNDGMCAVFLKGKWGFVDKRENLTVQPYYKEVKPFRNGFAPVKTYANKWSFIDKNGKPVNTTLYDDFRETKNEKYIVTRNKYYGITDSKGKEILSPKYEYVEELNVDFIKIRKDGKYGVMDYQENIIFYYQYDNVIYNPYLNSFFIKTNGGSRMMVLQKKK